MHGVRLVTKENVMVQNGSSNRLRALLSRLRRLLLNRYTWYLLVLILRVLKWLSEVGRSTDE